MTRKTACKVVAIAVLILVAWKYQGIMRRINNFRAKLDMENTVKRLHEPKADLSGLAPLRADGSEWFSKYHFIAHKGGIVQGRIGTDSLEAWEESYARGVRIIDADLNITSDGHLVLRHSWGEDLEQGTPHQMSYDEFMSTRIFMKYHPMDIEGMIRFMLAHDDLYVALDAKVHLNANIEAETEQMYALLIKAVRDMNAEEVFDRMIACLHTPEAVDIVRKMYPFKAYVLRQYGYRHNWYELAEYCLKNNVPVVNVHDFVVDNDPEGVKILLSKGIRVYTAVVDSLSKMQEYKDMGIYLAVSTFLSESDWELLR